MIFSANELIKILRACESTHVTELKIGDVVVKRDGLEVPFAGKRMSEISPPTDTELNDAHTDASLRSEADEADEQLAFMQIEAPEEYERLLVERKLEDGREVEDPVI